MLIFLIISFQFTHLLKAEHKTDFSGFEKANTELDYNKGNNGFIKKDSLFVFNPNTLNDNGWLALGVSEGKIIVLRNYQKWGLF